MYIVTSHFMDWLTYCPSPVKLNSVIWRSCLPPEEHALISHHSVMEPKNWTFTIKYFDNADDYCQSLFMNKLHIKELILLSIKILLQMYCSEIVPEGESNAQWIQPMKELSIMFCTRHIPINLLILYRSRFLKQREHILTCTVSLLYWSKSLCKFLSPVLWKSFHFCMRCLYFPPNSLKMICIW